MSGQICCYFIWGVNLQYHGAEWFPIVVALYHFFNYSNRSVMVWLLKKTDDNLLLSASFMNNFFCIWLVLKDPYCQLLFIFRVRHLDPTFVTCYDLTDFFRKTATIFFWAFISIVDTGLLLSNCQIILNIM